MINLKPVLEQKRLDDLRVISDSLIVVSLTLLKQSNIMRVVSTEIFKFSELPEKSKVKAREWYRKVSEGDNDWANSTIKDSKQVGRILGFNIEKIYYSGFWSQGSGACFEGTFRSSEFEAGGVQKYAPKDAELHRIANGIEAIINKFYAVYLKVNHSGHYYHENCTVFDVSITDNQDNEIDTKEAVETEKELIKLSRDLMVWIYRSLEKDYEYQNSDEVVDENIESNGYEFTADGTIWS